jgi:hypothetical protein
LAVSLVATALGCQAPMQRVPLHLEPADSRVYVDGSELAAGARHVELRSDEPHVVLAKRDGYRPQQIVLEPSGRGDARRLQPAEIRLELEPLVPKESAVRIERAD